jgi:hypothetical protein
MMYKPNFCANGSGSGQFPLRTFSGGLILMRVQPDPELAGPSPLDIERVATLYPPLTPAAQPQRRSEHKLSMQTKQNLNFVISDQ